MDRPKPAEEGEDAVAEKPAEAVDGAGSATPATPSRATSDKRDAYAQRDEDGDSPIPTIENDEPPPALLSPSSESENALESALPRGHTRVSIYVQVFTEMIETVLENESFLFNQEELDMIQRFQGMSYNARYLFVRLFARKNGWFRSNRLEKYSDEIGLENIQKAVDELCGLRVETEEDPRGSGDSDVGSDAVRQRSASPTLRTRASCAQVGPSNYIELNSSPQPDSDNDASGIITIDDDDDEDEDAERKASNGTYSASAREQSATDPLSNRSLEEVKKDQHDFGLSRFAINEAILAQNNDIDELLALLSLDELKALGKDLRITNKTTRSSLIETIKQRASTQSTLTSMFAVGAAKAAALAEAKRMTRKRGSAASARKGKQRETTADIASATVARQTEVLIAKILRHLGHCVKLESGPIRLFARLHLIYYRSVAYSEKTLTQAVLSRFKIRTYPRYAIKRSFNIFKSRQDLIDYEETLVLERRMEEYLGEMPVDASASSWRGKKFTKEDRERGLREGLRVFEDVYPRWQRLVKEAQEADAAAMKLVKNEDGELVEPPDDRLVYYRKRFLAGWPLTRVVYKGTTILAKLHEYDREVEVLQDLLRQTCFRRGKRGEWYDRLALVHMNHSPGDKHQNRERAMAVCREALAHPWTHLIYHNTLQRRLLRLEAMLDIPLDDRSPPVPGLRQAKKRVMKGDKLSGSEDWHGQGDTGKKSIWRASDGGEISVEGLALECYEREGWKGFHSENGILTTIFALLFWDVIFAPVDGVFETAYQSGPLDLSTDAFAIVRADLVEQRLQDIANGNAVELLIATDERERENRTWCVGVRWTYEREQLVEIVQCLGTNALGRICRIYAEEWSHRTGGVPDLFLWNFDKKICKFVEVKGPGDVLSETQKVWIDLLMSAGVQVELCSVQQYYEEDDLSLSETDHKKLTPLKRKKRANGTAFVDALSPVATIRKEDVNDGDGDSPSDRSSSRSRQSAGAPNEKDTSQGGESDEEDVKQSLSGNRDVDRRVIDKQPSRKKRKGAGGSRKRGITSALKGRHLISNGVNEVIVLSD